MEALLIATVTTVSVFVLATFLGTCVPVLEVHSDEALGDLAKPYFCPTSIIATDSGSQLPSHTSFDTFYNDMATIVYNSQEDAIQELFHQNG